MATLYCFSSTGNSLYTAKKIAEKTDGKIARMNGDSVTCNDDVIGFVFPVYFWGLPRMAERFITEMKIENSNTYVFAVATYGGAAPGTTGIVRKLLKPKGVTLQYGNCLKMVDNYIPTFKPKDSEALRQRVDENLKKIADAVVRRDCNRIQTDTFMNKISYRSLPGEDSDRFFITSSACTGCAICKKICPANNITMEEGAPVFHHKCEHCMGCLQNCPVCAIDWKEKTKGKERFRHNGIALDELISFNTL